MHCSVLGGTGFIGRHLVMQLLQRGCTVTVFSRTVHQDLRREYAQFSGNGLRWVEGDFSDPKAVEAALQGADHCFHLISTTLPRSSNDDPIFDITSNVGGTLSMLQTAIRVGVKRLVFASSGGTVYGPPQFLPVTEQHPLEPNCSYGIGKLAIEKYLQLFYTLHGLDYRIVRLSNPYGEAQQFDRAQGAVSVFAHRILNDLPIDVWGDGSTTRDYIHVADAVQGLMLAADYEGEERIFNIGSGEGRSLAQIISDIEVVLNRRSDVHHLPARKFDVAVNILSIERAQRALGFYPRVSFKEGLSRAIRWQQRALLTGEASPTAGLL